MSVTAARELESKPARKLAVFVLRFSSTIVLWTVALLIAFSGYEIAFWGLISLFGLISLWEFSGMLDHRGLPNFKVTAMVCGAVMLCGSFYYFSHFGLARSYDFETAVLLLFLLTVFTRQMFARLREDQPLRTMAYTLFGLLYVLWLFNFMTKILYVVPRSPEGAVMGQFYCLYLIAVTKFSDMGAYLTGSVVGRHPLIPHISPKKTWEGFFGAMGFSLLASLLLFKLMMGVTGSMGETATKVARDIHERMEIVGIADNSNAQKLATQANELRPGAVCLVDEAKLDELRGNLNYQPRIFAGERGLSEIASAVDADMVLIAIVGTGGLRPALAAIEAGRHLAVASKEILVMAGEIVMREARARNIPVLPVDSEHNAIFQCLDGRASEVRRIILTVSGGPFRQTTAHAFSTITVEEALKHPTWNMGPKITIDSATLFNKGLEMIEAHWLFGVEMNRVEVVIHPQSIVHSMVEFADGSTLAQLSYSNMCFPIQYAVTWPDRVPNTLPPLDFSTLGKLEFEIPRYEDFPALNLARRAGETGGTLPAVMNAANEIAVASFLARQLAFPQIWQTVAEVMDRHRTVAHPDLDAILAADQWARAEATAAIGKK